MPQDMWDVAVIGAGPAGTVAAHQLASHGCRVLLIDKATFPRFKVCGGCINHAAVQTLDQCGLTNLFAQQNAPRLTALHLTANHQTFQLPLQGGYAISRHALDHALVAQAVEKGVTFQPQTRASLGEVNADSRTVWLHPSGQSTGKTTAIRARVILAADGLGGKLLAGETSSNVSATSRIGLGAMLSAEASDIASGIIAMHVHRFGYVGHARMEDGRINVAAAVDARWLRKQPSPGNAIETMMLRQGHRLDVSDAHWHGTRQLTRKHALFAQRVLALGDAAGYVEPFTGQGMAWAIAAGAAVTPIAMQAVANWHDDLGTAWAQRYHQQVATQQRWCHLISRGVRHPRLVSILGKAANVCPRVMQTVVKKVQHHPQVLADLPIETM